jgi:hypothetical protein
MAVSWVVAACSLVEVYRRFRGVVACIMKERRENLKYYVTFAVEKHRLINYETVTSD